MYLIGGSIPERNSEDDNIYNTCTVYNPEGAIIATHRKVHLFDIDVPGKIRFQESETLTAGKQLTHVDTGMSTGKSFPSLDFSHDQIFTQKTLLNQLSTDMYSLPIPSFSPEFGKIGVGICYDIRFPEPAMIAARQGTELDFLLPIRHRRESRKMLGCN